MATDNHLCDLLVNLRSEREFSIRQMAKVCGVSRESIRKYETGASIPSNETLKLIFDKLQMDPQSSQEARLILISVYQARRERRNNGIRSFGPAAQVELEGLTNDQESNNVKAEKLAELFFEQVAPDRRTESLEFFIKQKILGILRS